jgi:hypothetical protein
MLNSPTLTSSAWKKNAGADVKELGERDHVLLGE